MSREPSAFVLRRERLGAVRSGEIEAKTCPKKHNHSLCPTKTLEPGSERAARDARKKLKTSEELLLKRLVRVLGRRWLNNRT
jgi:hypothetical protein